MATWPLFYLSEREVIPFPEKYFQAPLAQLVAQSAELQDQCKTRGVLAFTAIDAAELRDVMSAVSPTESDIFRYHKSQIEDALGVEAAQQRLREDATMPELVATCHEGFGWLLECTCRIDLNSIGLLIIRDTRRRRWLTRRWSGPATTVSS
jgi:hypothetical protein